jgi:DNA-binding transcriptional regulator YhcF (GntR family)
MSNHLSNSHQEIHGNTATSGISLYVRVAASIRSRILEGEWNSGEQLPKINSIAQSYGVAQITASKAIQALVAEGLLSSARGRGTHVLQNPEARTQHPDLRAAINDPRVLAPDHSIDILWKKTVSKLPFELEQNYQTAKKEGLGAQEFVDNFVNADGVIVESYNMGVVSYKAPTSSVAEGYSSFDLTPAININKDYIKISATGYIGADIN